MEIFLLIIFSTSIQEEKKKIKNNKKQQQILKVVEATATIIKIDLKPQDTTQFLINLNKISVE